MADGGPSLRDKILQYWLFYGAAIADYGGKPRHIGQYLQYHRGQNLPPISTMALPWPIFDNIIFKYNCFFAYGCLKIANFFVHITDKNARHAISNIRRKNILLSI
jgi:hypothetical protein